MSIAQLVSSAGLCWAFCVGEVENYNVWVSCFHCVDSAGEITIGGRPAAVIFSEHRRREGVDVALLVTKVVPEQQAFAIDSSRPGTSHWNDGPSRPGDSGRPIVDKNGVAFGVLVGTTKTQTVFTLLSVLPERSTWGELVKSIDLDARPRCRDGRCLVPRVFRRAG